MPVLKVDEPLEVVMEEDAVIVEGRGGIAFEMTPEAAIETSDRMHNAAVMAIGKRKHREWKLNDTLD
jgi:dethiobiotin synthetase